MADDPDLTGRVSLNLSGLVDGLRFAQAVTRRQISRLVRDANSNLDGLGGRLGGVTGRIRQALSSIDMTPLTNGLGRVGGMLGTLGGLALPFIKGGAAVGALIPLVAGLVAVLVQIAPAAALGVSALLALKLATSTFKLAMTGVGDAVKAALDPTNPTAYAEALKKLSPNARSFVGEIRRASPALDALRKGVQDKVFAGLDTQLRATGAATLPLLRRALLDTAGTLNLMGKGVLTAARDLSTSGTLGTALKGATGGLNAFKRVPGQIVTGLGQIAAAAAPTFQRLSEAGAGALDKISAKLATAFESGAMERAINTAVDLLGELFAVLGNVGDIFSSVFGAAQVSGGGMLGVLESITGEIARVAKTEEVQSGLKALFDVMAQVGETAGPLLGQALQILGPIFATLGPPIEKLIVSLGGALKPILDELGPVLLSGADAFGKLIEAVLPLLPVFGLLVAGLLPVLVPLFDALGKIFLQATPFIKIFADTLGAILTPLLAALPPILSALLVPFLKMAEEIFPLLTDALIELAPGLVDLAESLGELMVELAPLIAEWFKLTGALAVELMPVITKLAVLMAGALSSVLRGLALLLREFVIPSLKILAAVMKGDFQDAALKMIALGSRLQTKLAEVWAAIKNKASEQLGILRNAAAQKAAEIRDAVVQRMSELRSRAAAKIGELPGAARAALGNLGSQLASAGASLVQGFIDGIQSRIPSVQGVLSNLTSMLPSWKGPPRKDAKILTPAGRLLIDGFIRGIDESTAKLRTRLRSITAALPDNVRRGIGKTLARSTAELGRLVTQRDGVIKRLAAAEKKLTDLVKARDKVASDISGGILGGANITTGNDTVNSVGAITVGLQRALKAAQTFGANIAKLRKAGVRADLIQQVADAGVDGGGATAAALARATPAEVKRINDLQARLTASAKSTGATVADALYGAGVRAAQGLVKGLQSQEKAIERLMEKIARSMLAAVKKVHKTRSPSKAFAEIGVMDGVGLSNGLLSTRALVRAAAARVAKTALDAAHSVDRALTSVPQPGALTAAYAGGATGGGDTYNTFNLHGGDATPDGILSALSWRGLVAGRR